MFGLRLGAHKTERHFGQSRRQKAVRLLIALLIAPALALVSTGCAQKQSAPVVAMKPNGLTQSDPRRAQERYAEVELEDDGREAQQPPLFARKRMIDDPSQPYSPHYGRTTSQGQDMSSSDTNHDAYVPAPNRPSAEPVVFQRSMLR